MLSAFHISCIQSNFVNSKTRKNMHPPPPPPPKWILSGHFSIKHKFWARGRTSYGLWKRFFYAPKTCYFRQLLKFIMNRSYSLYPVCPKKIFRISKYFEKSKFEFSKFTVLQMHSRTLIPWKQLLNPDQTAPKTDLGQGISYHSEDGTRSLLNLGTRNVTNTWRMPPKELV